MAKAKLQGSVPEPRRNPRGPYPESMGLEIGPSPSRTRDIPQRVQHAASSQGHTYAHERWGGSLQGDSLMLKDVLTLPPSRVTLRKHESP